MVIDYSDAKCIEVFFLSRESGCIDSFHDDFKDEVRELSSLMSVFYDVLVKNRSEAFISSDRILVELFLDQLYQNCFDSTKLLCDGYFVASGHLMRHVLETFELVLLFAYDGKLKVNSTKNWPYRDVVRDYLNKKTWAGPLSAYQICRVNKDLLGLTDKDIEIMRFLTKHYGKVSHVTLEAVNFTRRGAGSSVSLGAGDDKYIENCKAELSMRLTTIKYMLSMLSIKAGMKLEVD